MQIYVASSWRNEFQQNVVARLREIGHRVYDFRGAGDGWGNGGDGPGGFGWHEIDPDWKQWPLQLDQYIESLKHPRAIEVFNRDMDALKRADAIVMVNPCGQSAHAEMGWACRAGKPTAVYIPGLREPDLMVKMASLVTTSLEDVECWLQSLHAPANSSSMNTAIASKFPDPEATYIRIGACCFGEGVIACDALQILKSFQRDTIVALADCMITNAADMERNNLQVTPEELKRQAQFLRDYADTLAPAAPEEPR